MSGKATTTVTNQAGGRAIVSNARPATREYSGDESQQRQTDFTERDTSGARSLPFAGGVVHESVVFTGTLATVNLAHKLSKKPQGWLVLRVTEGTNGVVETSGTDKVLTLVQTSVGKTTLTIMVF